MATYAVRMAQDWQPWRAWSTVHVAQRERLRDKIVSLHQDRCSPDDAPGCGQESVLELCCTLHALAGGRPEERLLKVLVRRSPR